MKFAPPRGMRDFYPKELRIRNYIFDIWREVSLIHGFEEYDAAVVETEELLVRKSGEEIINQIYTFEDKSGRKLALRPEMTPTLARMIINQEKSLSFPLKWFCIVQCFRYERMTKGRKREHYQWNLDIIGEESCIAEAEVLSAAILALQKLGLDYKDFQVRIGSRKLLFDLLKSMKFNMEYFQKACLVIDKKGKISDEEMKDLLFVNGINQEDIKKIFDIINIQDLEQIKKILKDSNESLIELNNLFELMKSYYLDKYITFDISIIRGLDYYTGIVFEAFDINKKFRAIFGGGRYNNLLSSLGGKSIPAVGLGFGDVVILEILTELQKIPLSNKNIDVVVGYMSNSERNIALEVTSILRNKGLKVDLLLSSHKAKKVFSYSNECKSKWTVFVGPDEAQYNKVTLKNMLTSEQCQITVSNIYDKIVD